MKFKQIYQLLFFVVCFIVFGCYKFPTLKTTANSQVISRSQQMPMYSQAKLTQEKSRFESRINELFTKGILPELTADERRVLKNVVLRFPLVGEISQTPIDFYAGESNGQPFVTMPVLSLLFLEDLFTAYAWLQVNGYSLETIDEYITMLKYKRASDFPGGYYLPPLEALMIPSDALTDKKVDELSLRFRNTAYAFILLHEMGHILEGHRGYRGITAKQAQSNEESADRFALEVLERTATIPMGAILFFQAQAYYMPNKGQFRAEGKIETEADWQNYLNTKFTHPLTTQRLNKMVLYLDRAANQNSFGADSQFLRYLAQELIKISDILEIEELQGCMAVVAHRADLSTLAPRKPRTKTASLLEQWCSQ